MKRASSKDIASFIVKNEADFESKKYFITDLVTTKVVVMIGVTLKPGVCQNQNTMEFFTGCQEGIFDIYQEKLLDVYKVLAENFRNHKEKKIDSVATSNYQ